MDQDGRNKDAPPPPKAAPSAPAPTPPSRQVEDVTDHLTPAERFERAVRRRDAVTPKPLAHPRKGTSRRGEK